VLRQGDQKLRQCTVIRFGGESYRSVLLAERIILHDKEVLGLTVLQYYQCQGMRGQGRSGFMQPDFTESKPEQEGLSMTLLLGFGELYCISLSLQMDTYL